MNTKKIPQLIQQTNLHSGPLTQKGFYRNVRTWNCHRHISISGEDLFEFLVGLDPEKCNLSNSTCLRGSWWLCSAVPRWALPARLPCHSSLLSPAPKARLWLLTQLACFSHSLECHKWGETGLAGHRRDPVTQLMRERKQFIVPNKCSISKYQAATTLLIPLAITFRFYATANSDFKLFLPARFSFSVRRGKPKKGLTDCCKQEPCKFSQFRPCQSSRTPQQVILTSIAFKKKKKKSSTAVPPSRLHKAELSWV